MSFVGWRIDPGLRRLSSPRGMRIPVTSAEFDLLLVPCQNPRRVLSRDTLIDLTQGPNVVPFDHSIDVLICRLRKKIAPGLMGTVRRSGYVFTPEVCPA